MGKASWWVVLMVVSLGAAQVLAQSSTKGSDSLNDDLAALKGDVAELNAELARLEEDILFPLATQVAVFLSVDAGDAFQLDAVDLSINDRRISSHVYTDQEREALAHGGVQKLYLGNLAQGSHRVTATVNGRGKNGQFFRNQQNFSITKQEGASRVELVVRAQAPAFNPEFTLKRWQ